MERIKQEKSIKSLLNQLGTQNVQLRVNVEGIEKEFTSFVITNDVKKGVILDEFLPRFMIKHINVGDQLEARSNMGGCLVNFTSTITGKAKDKNGATIIRCDFPNLINFKQQREFFRVSTRILKTKVLLLKITDDNIIHEDNIIREGIMVDLSEGGLGVEFDQEQALNSIPDDCYVIVEINEDEDLKGFYAVVKNRAARTLTRKGREHVGFVFEMSSLKGKKAENLKEIRKIVFEMQRRTLRVKG